MDQQEPQRPLNGELVTHPNANGGKLKNGNPFNSGNPNGGRSKQIARMVQERITDQHIEALSNMALGLDPDNPEDAQSKGRPTHKDQLRALELFFKLAKADNPQLHIKSREFAIGVMAVACSFIPPDKHVEFRDKVLEKLKEVAGNEDDEATEHPA